MGGVLAQSFSGAAKPLDCVYCISDGWVPYLRAGQYNRISEMFWKGHWLGKQAEEVEMGQRISLCVAPGSGGHGPN